MAQAIGIITANYSTQNSSMLTDVRPAASLPYAGRYRLIDFPMSNLVNCGVRTVGVVMPYNYRSIIDHIGSGKDWSLDRKNGGLFILPGSAFGSTREGSRFLLRDIDFNRLFLDRATEPYVIVSSSNVIFNMDYDPLIDCHASTGADITIVTRKATCDDPNLSSAWIEDGRVKGMHRGTKYGEDEFLDTFIIKREVLLKALDWYAAVSHLDLFEALAQDFDKVNVMDYQFNGYAASIFTTQGYFRHSMELLDPKIAEELFPEGRPVMTKAHDTPPAKYETGSRVRNSLVSAGSRISGSITGSILGRGVRVERGATVRNSLIGQGVVIESGAIIENAIVDRNNFIPAGTELRGTPEAVLVKEKSPERH
jgi:glucose-1-phosphate adenylyltransferase